MNVGAAARSQARAKAQAADRIEALEAQAVQMREAGIEEAAQIVLAMIEKEQARGDASILEWIDAWEMAFDNIRALKALAALEQR